jgi:SagB-type dehydrogenase family enzyme
MQELLNEEYSKQKKWVVSDYSLVSWKDGKIVVNAIASNMVLTTDDFRLLQIINAFALPATIKDVLIQFDSNFSDVFNSYILTLIEIGTLVSASLFGKAIYNNWHWSALAYHNISRHTEFQIPTRSIESNLNVPSKLNLISLTKGFSEKGKDFANVLMSRRSRRNWPKATISFETFSEFLWLSCNNRISDSHHNNTNSISRPYPSGGGIYSLMLYIAIGEGAVEGISAGIYKYSFEDHFLEQVLSNNRDYVRFLKLAGDAAEAAPAPVAIFITSKYNDQSEVYGDISYSLILKEIGCIFQTFYLVGEYLELSCCALGASIPYGSLASICYTNELTEPLVGEFLIAPR